MILAPIVLFVYNRPRHTQQTVEAVLKNVEAADSDLIVYSDAPKNDEVRLSVEKVRLYLKNIEGFKSVRIVERGSNLGLAKSIISGVREVVEEHGQVIVLEDDLVTSPYFLQYMNDALMLYKDDERVISIHGYNYPIESELPETFFIKGADCWGWATWKRGWDLFEADGDKLLKQLGRGDILDRFDLFGAYDFSGMLRGLVNGENQSWAVRWYASALLLDKLTLYPRCSLVQNIGNDDSGSHCSRTDVFNVRCFMSPVKVGGVVVEENKYILMLFSRFLRKVTHPSFMSRVVRRLRRMTGG